MGSKLHPGKFDCYENAEPDEPMFILLGRDRHGADLVRLWALMRHAGGEDEAVVGEALECAKSMDAELLMRGKSPGISATQFERIFTQITAMMGEHPQGWDSACHCRLCLSYAE
jgi:hypothetical protein